MSATSASDEKPTTSAASATPPIRVFYDGRRFLVWNTRDVYTLRCLHRIVGSLVGALPTNKRQTQEFGIPLSLLFEEALLLAEEGIAEVVDVSDAVPLPPKPAPDAVTVAGEHDDAAKPPPEAASPAPAVPPTQNWLAIPAECEPWMQSPFRRLEPQQIRLAPGARLLHAPVFRALWNRGFFITCGNSFGGDYLCYPGDPMRHHAHLVVHVARPGRPTRFVEVGCASRLANAVKKTGVLAEVQGSHDVRFAPIEQPQIDLFPFPMPSESGSSRQAARGRGKTALPAAESVEGVDESQPSGTAAGQDVAEAKALIAPVEGSGVQVPAPRVKTRRARAPWEAEEINPDERRGR